MSIPTLFLIVLVFLALLVAVLPESQRVLIYGLRKPVNGSVVYLREYFPFGIPESFVDDVLLDIAAKFKINPTKIRPNDNFFWLLSSFQTVFDSGSNEKLLQLIIQRFPDNLELLDEMESMKITTVKELICFLWTLKSHNS